MMPRKLLTRELVESSPVARRMLLHLYSIGDNEHPGITRHEAYTKPGAAVVWVKSGRGTLRIGSGRWNLDRGPFFWVYGTDQVRFVEPLPRQSIIMHAFWFSGPGLESWLEELDVKRRPQFSLQCPQRIQRAYRAMLGLVHARPPNWELRIHLQLTAIMGEFIAARGILAPQPGVLPLAVARVLNAIEADPARNWRLAELAAVARMSQWRFRELFRKTMNTLPHSHLQQVRLRLARELLADPSLLIKEIAARLHFANADYFSHFFHSNAGISPMEFRRLAQKSHTGKKPQL